MPQSSSTRPLCEHVLGPGEVCITHGALSEQECEGHLLGLGVQVREDRGRERWAQEFGEGTLKQILYYTIGVNSTGQCKKPPQKENQSLGRKFW